MRIGRKVLFVDNVVTGSNHQTINSGIINAFHHLFEREECNFQIYGDEDHLNAIKPLVVKMDFHHAAYIPIKVTLPQSGIFGKVISWFKKLSKDYQILKSIVSDAKNSKPDYIVFQTLVATNLFFIKRLINQASNQKFLLVLHGEIEYVFRKPVNLKTRINGLLYRAIFANPPENLRFIVLSDLVKQKLTHKGYSESRRIISIEHPLSEFTRVTTMPEGMHFAHLGVANYRKKSQYFFLLANRLKPFVESGKISMQLIGRNDLKEPEEEQLVKMAIRGNKNLNRQKYHDCIEKSTFAISLIQGEDYVYRISGSLLDSLQYQLPIIALRHDYVNWLFDNGGDIGYLCSTFEEMEELIKKMALGEIDISGRYPDQVNNLKLLAKKFYPTEISRQLQKQL